VRLGGVWVFLHIPAKRFNSGFRADSELSTAAKNQAVSFPESTVDFVKNDIGSSKRFPILGREYSAEELSAFILKYLKDEAESTLGEKIEQAVITVPAIFGENERQATKAAGRLAKLDVIQILDEPVAAALFYGLGRGTTGARAENVLVYDLGGGTFDLTVISVDKNRFTVISTGGNRRLGGKDWDYRIIDYVAKAFEMKHDFDPQCEPESKQDLRERCERAKKHLSTMDQVSINCGSRGRTHKVDLSALRCDGRGRLKLGLQYLQGSS
jgi:molecular chaperone DnaK